MLKPKKDVDDGWAWAVLAGSFMNLLLASGIAFVSGIFQKLFLEKFQETVAFTAWVTSLFSSFMQLAGPLSGILASVTNCRTTVMVGGALLAFGLAASSFAKSMSFLLVTFGLCGGIGLGLLYSPSIVVVNFFFDRRRTVVTGVALSAGGIGIIGAPVLSRYLIDQFTWQEALLVLACLSAHTCVFGALMFPIHEPISRCGRLYHRFLGREKRKHSEPVQAEYADVNGMFASDQDRTVEESDIKNVNHPVHSIQHATDYEDGDSAVFGPGEHQNTKDVSLLQTSDSCDLQQGELQDADMKQEISECVLVAEGDMQADENASLVQNSLADSTADSKRITGSKQSLVEKASGHNASKAILAFPSIQSLQDVGLSLGVSAACGSDIEAATKLKRKKESNLDVFRNFSFIMLCVNLFLSNAACGIFNIHLPAFSEQRGINDQEVAIILALDGVAVFVSRILLGALGHDEKVDQLAVYFGLHAISSFTQTLLSFANSMVSVTAMVMLMGIYYGSTYTLLSSLTISLVGLPRLAFAFGVEMISAGFGYLVAPPLAGWVVDKTGNYNNSMYLGGFLMFLSAIAVLFVSCGKKIGTSLSGHSPLSVEEEWAAASKEKVQEFDAQMCKETNS